MGVVEGDEIPYQPWAAAKKKENAEHWLERDPEVKCYCRGFLARPICRIRFKFCRARTRF